MSVLVVGISHRSAPVARCSSGSRSTATASPSWSQRRAALRARHRGDRHRDLQPARDLRRRRPLPRQRRGRLPAARRARRREPPRTSLPHLYVHYDDGAVSHLFQVAAGLDSMAVGEGQILGQTREALRLGQELGTVGPALNVLFQQALRVGKRAHAETDIDRAAPSLVSAALDALPRRRRRRRRQRVLVVGAGAMAGLADRDRRPARRRRDHGRQPQPDARPPGGVRAFQRAASGSTASRSRADHAPRRDDGRARLRPELHDRRPAAQHATPTRSKGARASATCRSSAPCSARPATGASETELVIIVTPYLVRPVVGEPDRAADRRLPQSGRGARG